MYQICESPNFIWSNKNFLGEGATATVYQGMNKLSGDLVAVKCYRRYITEPEYQLREYEVLRKIKHENIVQLIAIEECLADRKNVIVMELCKGGSLSTDLMDPENACGLVESEFLLVLKHLYGGMKYLRENNIIHRDLKPENIMKCIQEDGTNIYKLTDFGAARELMESETFQSIYGTEQYLHPDVYERAILRRPVNKEFNSSVDLWSIGVTLYHIATGTLPFVPYMGYKNKETMHYITARKVSGVISGIQTRENGPVTWSRTLPETCFLSDTLKRNIIPVISGVLEADHAKIWGFDKFFNEVDILLSRIVVNIFYANKATLLKIYMSPNQRYEDLKKCITSETDIDGANQILLHKGNFFKNVVQEFTEVCEYPKTSENHPLFLFTKENIDFSVLPIQIPKWVDFPNSISVEGDMKTAKCACSIGHYCKRHIDMCSLYCKLINDSVVNLIDYISNQLNNVQLTAHRLFETIRVHEKTANILWKINKCSSNSENKLVNITKKFEAATKLLAYLYNLQCNENTLKSKWDSTMKDLKRSCTTCASAIAKTQVEELRKSWQYFINEPINPKMSYGKCQWHALERKRVRQELCSIIDLLQKETFSQYQQMSIEFGNWYGSAHNLYLKTTVLKSNIERFEKKLKDFENELTVDYNNYVRNIDQVLKNDVTDANKFKRFELRLKNYLKNKDNFEEILLENSRLMNQIQDFKCMKL